MKILTGLAGVLLICQLSGQPNKYGVPLITNYPYDITGGSEQNWCITQDHRGMVYVGNQDKGVLEYDGVSWRRIPVPGNIWVQSMTTGDDGVVYVGCEGDVGRLVPDESGNLYFQSLCDSVYKSEYPGFPTWETSFENGMVCFSAAVCDILYDTRNDSSIYIPLSESFSLSYLSSGMHLNASWDQGLTVYRDTGFVPLPGGDFFQGTTVFGIDAFGPEELLVGTYESGVFVFNYNSGEARPLGGTMIQEVFADAAVPFTRTLKDQESVLVGTQYDNHGLYILDKSGNVKSNITKNEGLLDATIAYSYQRESMKNTDPLWVAHFKGISKIETNSPFRKFNEKSGFEGLITDMEEWDSQLYISTVMGVFRKVSTATNTSFHILDEMQDQVWDLMIFAPEGKRKFLLASSSYEVYIMDENMRVSRLSGLLENNLDIINGGESLGGRKMITDPGDPSTFYTGTNRVLGITYLRGKWELTRTSPALNGDIFHMTRDAYDYLWITTDQNLSRIDMSIPSDTALTVFSEEEGLPDDKKNYILELGNETEILVGTVDGFYNFNYLEKSFLPDSLLNGILPGGSNKIHAFHVDREGDYWISFENSETGWTEMLVRPHEGKLEVLQDIVFQRLPNASVDVFKDDDQNGVWFSKADELFHFTKDFNRNDSVQFSSYIRGVSISDGDSILFNGSHYIRNEFGDLTIHDRQEKEYRPVLPHRYNNIGFQWTAPFFEQEDKLLYSFYLEGFSKEWSDWSALSSTGFTNLGFGKYTFRVKARNVYGEVSAPANFAFVILRPWYASIPALFGYIILSGLVVYLIIRLYTQRLKNENIRLEGIIRERTAEIVKQKEELTDSIEYASRIQRAMLPSSRLMKELDIEHFILFRPRDIVSGDFYWMGFKNNKLLIVAADCTGHGVPGAFMSMLGMTFLDEIVIKSEITNTETIMESLREHVINSLEQSDEDREADAVKDGMDLAMIAVDMHNNTIQYSGAYNPLYLVRKLNRSEKNKLKKGEALELPRGAMHSDEHILFQLRADQMPIGTSEKTLPFTSETFENEEYNMYMFSDGFVDQFGGPDEKKFMSRNFKKLLLELQSIPLQEQGKELEKALVNWMGVLSQIDDILVLGIRINSK